MYNTTQICCKFVCQANSHVQSVGGSTHNITMEMNKTEHSIQRTHIAHKLHTPATTCLIHFAIIHLILLNQVELTLKSREHT